MKLLENDRSFEIDDYSNRRTYCSRYNIQKHKTNYGKFDDEPIESKPNESSSWISDKSNHHPNDRRNRSNHPNDQNRKPNNISHLNKDNHYRLSAKYDRNLFSFIVDVNKQTFTEKSVLVHCYLINSTNRTIQIISSISSATLIGGRPTIHSTKYKIGFLDNETHSIYDDVAHSNLNNLSSDVTHRIIYNLTNRAGNYISNTNDTVSAKNIEAARRSNEIGKKRNDETTYRISHRVSKLSNNDINNKENKFSFNQSTDCTTTKKLNQKATDLFNGVAGEANCAENHEGDVKRDLKRDKDVENFFKHLTYSPTRPHRDVTESEETNKIMNQTEQVEHLNNETNYQFDKERTDSQERMHHIQMHLFNNPIVHYRHDDDVRMHLFKHEFKFEPNFVGKTATNSESKTTSSASGCKLQKHNDGIKINSMILKGQHIGKCSAFSKSLIFQILFLLITLSNYLNANELNSMFKNQTHLYSNNSRSAISSIDSYKNGELNLINLDDVAPLMINYFNLTTDNLIIKTTTSLPNYLNSYLNYQNQLNVDTTSINETNATINSTLFEEKWWLNFFPAKYMDEKLELSEFLFRVFGVFICSVLICLTLFGNILTIIVVLRFNRMKTVTNILLAR